MTAFGNLLARCSKYNLGTFSTSLASGGAAVELVQQLGALATLGRDTRREGMSDLVLKVAALQLYPTYNIDVGAGDVALPGRRLHELLGLEIVPQGWPADRLIDCRGADLRYLTVLEAGMLQAVDPTDTAAAAGAVSKEGMLWVPVAPCDAVRPEDNAVDALAMGRGSLRARCIAVDGATLTAMSISQIRVVAWCFWGHPGHPVGRRFRTFDITSLIPNVKVPTEGRRLRKCYFRVDGGQATVGFTRLPGSFNEAVTVQLWREGKLDIDLVRIGDLADGSNMQAVDSIGAGGVPTGVLTYLDDRADPEHVVLLGCYGAEMTSKLPRLGGDGMRCQFSADPRDADSGGKSVVVAIDETFPFERGTTEFAKYEAASGYPAGSDYHRVAESKNDDIDPAKADALPWRLKPAA